MLLLFDGYDELSEGQRSKLSVFQKVLSKQLLHQATVVVTSRPFATKSLHTVLARGKERLCSKQSDRTVRYLSVESDETQS